MMKNKPGLIEEISEKLCGQFEEAVPLTPAKLKSGKRLSTQDIKVNSSAALSKFYEVADEERSKHGLGLIGRARVAFNLQQRLLKAGYPVPLVKQVLLAMLASAFVRARR